MLTFLQLKNAVRSRVFPAGESRNLRPAHDKSIVDALVDIQRWVDCFQNNNTFLAPHCSTFFQCGLTSFDFPRSRIKSLSVVDKATSTETTVDSDSETGGSSSTTTGLAVGTVAATVNTSIAIFANPSLLQELYTVGAAQSFTVAMTASSSTAQYYNSVAAQYVRAEITYTDPDGVQQTLQIGQEVRVSDASVSASITIAVQAGSTIYYSLKPYNTPFTDGGVNFQFVVTSASAAAVVSVAGNTTSSADTQVVTSGGDWCNEVHYDQVEPCEIKRYLATMNQAGGCSDISEFFAIPRALCGNKTTAPTPTDEGVAPSLPALQLGYHYPQTSTDSAYGRATAGVWAIENGRIYVAPWIESTETVVVKWEGIKRDWVDDDLVDDDPSFVRAIEQYLRWEHSRDWDGDMNKSQLYELEYRKALAELIYDCEEENRVRGCEPSHARGIARPDVDTFTPDEPTTPPTPPTPPTVYYNDRDFTAYAPCSSLQVSGNPVPTGAGNSVTVKKGTVTGTSVSEANSIAEDTAAALAAQGLVGKCTFHNKEVTKTAVCPNGDTGGPFSSTVPASTADHDTTISQAAANESAGVAAQNAANAQLVGCDTPPTEYWNTRQELIFNVSCTFPYPGGTLIHGYTVNLWVAANRYSSTESVAKANWYVQQFLIAKRQQYELGCTQSIPANSTQVFELIPGAIGV